MALSRSFPFARSIILTLIFDIQINCGRRAGQQCHGQSRLRNSSKHDWTGAEKIKTAANDCVYGVEMILRVKRVFYLHLRPGLA